MTKQEMSKHLLDITKALRLNQVEYTLKDLNLDGGGALVELFPSLKPTRIDYDVFYLNGKCIWKSYLYDKATVEKMRDLLIFKLNVTLQDEKENVKIVYRNVSNNTENSSEGWKVFILCSIAWLFFLVIILSCIQ